MDQENRIHPLCIHGIRHKNLLLPCYRCLPLSDWIWLWASEKFEPHFIKCTYIQINLIAFMMKMWWTERFTLNRLKINYILWLQAANFMTCKIKKMFFLVEGVKEKNKFKCDCRNLFLKFVLKWKKIRCEKSLSPTSLLTSARLNLWGMVTCSGEMLLELLALQGLVKL